MLLITFTRAASFFFSFVHEIPSSRIYGGSEDTFRNVRQVVASGASREGKEEEDEEEIKQKTAVAEAVDWSGAVRGRLGGQEGPRFEWARARGPRKGELAGAPCPRRLISGSPEKLSQHLRRV